MNTHPWRPLLRRILLPSLTGPFRRVVAVAAASVALLTQNSAHAYTHPCMPLTNADIAALNANKSTGQWAAGYAALASDWHAQLTYVQRGPFVEVGRNPNVNLNQWRDDMKAIWALSMQWKFTGNSEYAEKAKAILLSWATTHTVWSGIEPYLEQGDFMKFYGTGASILRSYSGWTAANTTTVKNYMANIHYPSTTVDIPLRSANQGAAHLEGGMGVAVYNDDVSLFNRVLNAYRNNACTGLRNTQSNGQIGDTGRDVGHARVELLHYAWISEVALKAAGVDLFAESNNRLLAAGEYFSNYNNGGSPAFIKSGSCYFDIFTQITSHAPGHRAATIGPDFLHILHSAYVVRKGLSMPYLTAYRANQTDDMFTWVFRKASDSSTGTSLPGIVTVTPAATNNVGNLTRVDIGGSLPASSVSYSSGTWSVTGGGADIWGGGASDSCAFAYTPVVGDATMIARVTGVGTASAPMAGLMFRETLAADSKMAMIVNFKGTAGTTAGVDGLGMSTRGATSNSHYTNARWHPQGGVPYWIKIERRGTRLTQFSSPDGTNWSPSHHAEFSTLAPTGYIGLCVASRANGTPTTATFTNVAVSGGLADGTYRIRSRATGRYLDSWGSTTNGTPLYQYTSSTNNNQKWALVTSSGYSKLTAIGGGKTIDSLGVNGNGTAAGLWAASTSTNQQWTVVALGNGYYKIVNIANGYCLDTGGLNADQAPVQFWGSGGSNNQQWAFERQ